MAELVSATLSNGSPDCTAVYLFYERVPHSRVTLSDPATAIREDHHYLEHFERCWNRRSCDFGYIDHCRIVALVRS
jgi:hypothetical protein